MAQHTTACPGPLAPVGTPAALALEHPVLADCGRYDTLRRLG